MTDVCLNGAAAKLLEVDGLDGVQAVVRSAARQVTGAHGATLVLRDGDQCFYADEDAISPLWKGQRFPIGACISGWAMLHAEAVIVPDIARDDRIPLQAYRPTFVKSLAVVPIGLEEPIGAIGAYWATLHRATSAELAALTELARCTSEALRRVGDPLPLPS